MNEEIQFGMGLDTSGIAAGMRSASHIVKEGMATIKETVIDGFKEALAPIAGAFAVTKIFESIKNTAEWAKSIRLTGEEAGVSSLFVQGLEAAAHKLGISFESSANSLAFLSRKIGEARSGSDEAQKIFAKWGITIENLSNEQIFYEIADKMREIEDPALRSAMAFETLGKNGRELGIGLAEGAAAMRNLVDEASKLSDEEITKLDTVNEKIEEAGRRWHLFWGSLVAQAIEMPGGGFSEEKIIDRMRNLNAKFEYDGRYENGIGPQFEELRDRAIMSLKKENEEKIKSSALSAKEIELLEKADQIRAKNGLIELSTSDKIESLLEKKQAIETEIETRRTEGLSIGKESVELANTETEILENQKKLKKEIAEADKKAMDEEIRMLDEAIKYLEKEERIEKTTQERKKAIRERDEHGRSYMTLAEIADADLRSGIGLRNKRDAQRIGWLEKDEALARAKGNTGFADNEKKERLRLTSELEARGAVKPEHYLEDISEKIGELNRKLLSEGIVIKDDDK